MEPWQLTATAMKAALDAGSLSSVELVTSLQARADAVEPLINGFVAQYREGALAQARASDALRARGGTGPLLGLPLSVKENFGLVGTAASVGVRAKSGRVGSEDAALVRVAREAGAVFLGKTNVPQLLLSMESENPIYGATKNPWKADRSPGGSSGGEGAVIAAGASPMGIGTDIGGSIRNPAAWCGICGLKPTAGRWSLAGVAGGQPGQEAVRAQSGPMARTVDDLALLLGALSPEAQHAVDAAVPALPFVPPEQVDVSKLVIGVYEEDVLQPVASVRRAVAEAARALEAAGATVVTYTPTRSWEMVETYFGLMGADGFTTALAQLEGDPWSQQLNTVSKLARMPRALRTVVARALGLAGEHRLARLLASAGEKRVAETWALTVRRNALRKAELNAWQALGIDVLIGAPVTTPAAILRETHDWSLGAWPTMRWNLLDLPAGVVPVSCVRPEEADHEPLATAARDRLDRKSARFAKGSAGLPLAVQVAGRPWEEHLVLAVMKAVETHRDPATAPVTPVTPFPCASA